MDTVKQLAAFLQKASINKDFYQSHYSLYGAVLMCYANGMYQNPFRISRRILMKYSGIHSFATYHKCMKDLVLHNFVDYQPSYHPHLGSQLWLLNDDKVMI